MLVFAISISSEQKRQLDLTENLDVYGFRVGGTAFVESRTREIGSSFQWNMFYEPFGISSARILIRVRYTLIRMVYWMPVAVPRVTGRMLGSSQVLSVAAHGNVPSFDDLPWTKLQRHRSRGNWKVYAHIGDLG